MPAGMLRDRVIIKKRSTAQDALGQPVETWTEHMRVWADVRHRTGLQRLSADAIHSGARCSIRIRNTSTARTIEPGMRAVVQGQDYTVMDNPPQDLEWIDLVCEVKR